MDNKNVIDKYKSKWFNSPISQPDEEHEICRCKRRPVNCVCFKEPGTSFDSSGNKTRIWITPPPSPIVRKKKLIDRWSIKNDDYVYVTFHSGKTIKSKTKYSDYNFPHCHQKKCLERSFQLYYENIENDKGAIKQFK